MLKQVRNMLIAGIGLTALAIIFLMSCTDAYSDMSSDKRFQIAMKVVLKHEGGLSNDKADPGGITNYGISLRYLKAEHLCINGDCSDTANEIIHLTMTQADDIYYKQWYTKNHYDLIQNQALLTDILDFSVNAGSGECHKLIKRALNAITGDDIPVNGILDEETLGALNLIEPAVFHKALQHEQEAFYRAIVKRNPSLKVFLKGWLRRIGN